MISRPKISSRSRIRPLLLAALLAGAAGPGSPAAAQDAERCGLARSCPWVVAASAVVPGTGQWFLDQKRTWAYAAAEAVGWIAFARRRSDARGLEDAYRDLAWETARSPFAATRREADFEYYEALSHFDASGARDAEPGRPGLQPETDPTTYNGRVWALARELYLGGGPADEGSEAYDRALEYYRQRSYSDELRWSWEGRDDLRERYGELIRSSDDRYREATIAVGFVVANHLVSAVDAFLSSRLRTGGHDPAPLSLRARPHGPDGWALELHWIR